MVISTINKFFLLFFFIFFCNLVVGQEINLEKDKVKIYFKNFSDLIFINVNFNGHKNLNFILDTGTNGIILFNKDLFSPEQIVNGKDVQLRGLGSDSLLDTKLISGNSLKISNKLYSDSINAYYIENNEFNLGARFGIDVEGIIGNNFFRDFVLHIDYLKNKVMISKKPLRINKYESAEFNFINGKPFIYINDKDQTYELLLDSGGQDALWLFDSELDWQEVAHIRDFLGFGLSGEVVGNRIRKDSIYFENHLIEKIYLAIPDSNYTDFIKQMYPTRDGSVGAQFMRRFDWIIDYGGDKIYYKPNRNFKKEFTYNVTGMEVYQPISFLKLFVIESVLKDSPADLAGLNAEDVIVKINNIGVTELSLKQIYNHLNNTKTKKMTITINRNGQSFVKEIPIRDILNE